MKKFIIRSFLFFIPIIIFAYSVDYIITGVLRKSKMGDFAVWNDLFDGKINADIVIYGSSRAWVQINPKTIEDSVHENTYNLGVDGHNFYMEYLRHQILLRANKKPKTIILSLDCFTLYKRKDLYNDQQFLAYLNDPLVKQTISTYQGYSFFDYKLPLVKYVGKKEALDYGVKTLLTKYKYDTANRYKGYAGQNAHWNNDLENAKSKKQAYVQLFDTASITLFDHFLQDCKEKGIKVIMVYTPEYIEGQKFVSNRAEVFSYFNKFSKKYNIPFFDYSADPICSNKELFYNSQHLNKTGSDLFTKKFVTDMKSAHCF